MYTYSLRKSYPVLYLPINPAVRTVDNFTKIQKALFVHTSKARLSFSGIPMRALEVEVWYVY
jgi:hypothetical protein